MVIKISCSWIISSKPSVVPGILYCCSFFLNYLLRSINCLYGRIWSLKKNWVGLGQKLSYGISARLKVCINECLNPLSDQCASIDRWQHNNIVNKFTFIFIVKVCEAHTLRLLSLFIYFFNKQNAYRAKHNVIQEK